jgi:hypothetical protein
MSSGVRMTPPFTYIHDPTTDNTPGSAPYVGSTASVRQIEAWLQNYNIAVNDVMEMEMEMEGLEAISGMGAMS